MSVVMPPPPPTIAPQPAIIGLMVATQGSKDETTTNSSNPIAAASDIDNGIGTKDASADVTSAVLGPRSNRSDQENAQEQPRRVATASHARPPSRASGGKARCRSPLR